MAEIPYIGVTGASSVSEVQHLTRTFLTEEIHANHQPMIGILASQSTLSRQPLIETRSGIANRRYPLVATIPNLFRSVDKRAFTTVHYYSRQPDTLASQLLDVFHGIYEEGLSSAVQLNIPWPPKEQLSEAKRKLPNLKIILQLSSTSLNGNTPQEVTQRLKNYGSLVEYVLFDLSGGEGKEFQPSDILAFYEDIHTALPQLSIGFAGGFTGDNVARRVEQLAGIIGTKEFSIDAEGGLRDKVTQAYGDDTYNEGKAEAYIAAAKQAFA